MSAEVQGQTPEQPQDQQAVQNDKEINFAKVRKRLDDERAARVAAEQKVAEYERAMHQKKQQVEDEEDPSDEPYVDYTRLNRKLSKFERNLEAKIDKKAEEKAKNLLEEHKRNEWMKANPDFYAVMDNAQKFADKNKGLADTILTMPDNFERQQLVYENIKALGMHLKEQPKQSIQDKIDQNRRGPGYQPSGVASAPYAVMGDFSEAGQKAGFAKMQEILKNKRGL